MALETDCITNRGNSNPASLIHSVILFLLNAVICFRLLRTEYVNQLPSVEGLFISLARYIQRQRPHYDWIPLWHAGMPFSLVYQPMLHQIVATVATVCHISPAFSYHVVTGLAYAFGPVALYWLAVSLSRNPPVSFCAALIFSLFSPSLLLSAIRTDAGGMWNARRLQALVVYGEGPNILGLALCMIALAAFHWGLIRKTAASTTTAAIAMATVPATNWPATVALTLGLVCYLAALPSKQLRLSLSRIAVIGVMVCCFASPFALPSTIWSTFKNTSTISGYPTPGFARWVAIFVLFASIAVLRKFLLSFDVSVVLRFAILYSALLGGVVLAAVWFGIRLVPQPVRFHIAMEIGLVLTMAFAGSLLCAQWPQVRTAAMIAFLLACGLQFVHYRRYARDIIKPLEIRNTVEYQMADWFDRTIHTERVMASGTTSDWMNIFTDTPQLRGCCEQSATNPEDRIADYVIRQGYRSEEQTADYSLLWLKAYAVHAVAIGGPHSREHYKDFEYPYRFEGRLPLDWQEGDDRIYRVPARAPGLARVTRSETVVRHPPQNGIDVAELRKFVADLDNPALPILETSWQGPNRATIRGSLAPDDVISVAVNFDRGWTASANGRPAHVYKDGLGFIVIQPNCSTSCVVELRWTAGWEPQIAEAFALLALAAGIFSWWREVGRAA
jgi:hypothetical protein